MTQAELDAALDRQYSIPVSVSKSGPLPVDKLVYDPIRQLVETGLIVTPRQLIHVIGSKTAALPSSSVDECIRAGLLYTYVLDLAAPHLRFKNGLDSDLQTPRSQELGIGTMCILASQCFGVPWDQLGAIPGRGLRFDYRGQRPGFDGIFESKGTSYKGNQGGQILHGIEKKNAHHERGERFDVELIISTFVGRGQDTPRIVVADPDFDELAYLYEKADARFFRLRHYVRVLQYLGLTKSAYMLNRHAINYFKGKREIRSTILDEKSLIGFLDTESFSSERYLGRWFDKINPETGRRSKARYGGKFTRRFGNGSPRRVFQGIREDVYRAAFGEQPFSQQLLSSDEIKRSLSRIDHSASMLPDGTIQIFSK
jgi:hypothetical protein